MLLALVLVASAQVRGQAPAQTGRESEARVLFEQGVSLAADERHAEALELFRASFELLPRASTAINVAIELHRLGRGREAIATLHGLDALEPTETDQRDAELLRERIMPQLATLVLHVEPRDADVRVDGARVPGEGSPRTLLLDPGRHHLSVEAPAHAPMRRELRMMAGTSGHERVQLEALAPPAPPRIAAASALAPPSVANAAEPEANGAHAQVLEPPPRRRAGLIAGIGAGAAVVLGAVLTAVLLSRREPELYGGTFPPDDALRSRP